MIVSRTKLLAELEAMDAIASLTVEPGGVFVFKDGAVEAWTDGVEAWTDEVPCSSPCCLKFEAGVLVEPLLNVLRLSTADKLTVNVTERRVFFDGGGRHPRVAVENIGCQPYGASKPGPWKPLPPGFLKAISLAHGCIGKYVDNSNLEYIHIAPGWIEASDNEQAVRYELATGFKGYTPVLPGIAKPIVKARVTRFSQTPNRVHFENDNGLRLSCRRFKDKYPDTTKVWSGKGDRLTLPPELYDVAKRISTVNEDGDVEIELRKNRMKIVGISESRKTTQEANVELFYEGTCEGRSKSVAPGGPKL